MRTRDGELYSEIMPLVMVSGLPCSGKTRRVAQLVEYMQSHHPEKQFQVVCDDFSSAGSKNEIFSSAREEKTIRAALKSNTERYLNSERIVIVDSLNYIKGYRYELYCLSKHVKTPQCVLHCDVSPEEAREWNTGREVGERYSAEVFDGLVMRFETPDSRNRWDSPLFVVQPDDPLPAEAVMAALLHRKPPPPNLSTQSQPLSSADFLHELDRRTQEVVLRVLESQRTAVPGDSLTVSGSEKLRLPRFVTMAELRRLRKQFINYTKLHPPENATRIPNLFVQYLNSSL